MKTQNDDIQKETNDNQDSEIKALKQRLESIGVAKRAAKNNGEPTDAVVLFTKKIPRITRFFESWGKALGDNLKAFMQIPVIGSNEGALALSAGFGLLGGVFLLINFLRIPLLYLTAFLLGEKVPFTLKNNVKFAFAGISCALFIVAVAFPPSVPIISIIGASFGLVTSLYALAKVSIKGIVLRVQLNTLAKELEELEQLKAVLLKEKEQLKQDLTEIQSGKKNTSEITQRINKLEKESSVLEQKISQNKEVQVTKQKSLNKIGFLKIFDKCMAIGLSALVLIGVIVSIFYPPIGLGILGGAAALGAFYMTLRFLVPPLVNYLKKLYVESRTDLTEDVRETGLYNRQLEMVNEALQKPGIKKNPKNNIENNVENKKTELIPNDQKEENQSVEPLEKNDIGASDSPAIILKQ